MQVLRVVAQGLTTSFRLPHFMHGVQPTFRMPPPATIYGHICSTLGYPIEPEGLAFAYHFTAKAIFHDIEHTHVLAISSGRLPGTDFPKVLEGNINPFKREILFQPRLVLYLNRPEWLEAFRSPRYSVVLGRSQDLFTYTSVQVIDLLRTEHAYLEHTLLPYSMAVQLGQGVVELLPRYLDYARNRTPTFARYLLLDHRVHSDDFWRFGTETAQYWIDPTSHLEKNSQQEHPASLGLIFHTFTGDEYEAFSLS